MNYNKLEVNDNEEDIELQTNKQKLELEEEEEIEISLHSEIDNNSQNTFKEYNNNNNNNNNKTNKNKNTNEMSCFNTIWCLLRRAIPVALTFALGNVANFITLYFAGHININNEDNLNDTDIFAGVSMSTLFSNISCLSILVGMTGAVETLGSQNYGAKNYVEVGIVLQRSIVILTVLLVPVLISWYYVESIFLFLNVSPSICHVMKQFLRIRAFSIPCDVVSQSYQKYLMSIGVTSPSLIGTIILIILIFIFNMIFLRYYHFGYTSLAWSYVLAKYISDSLIIITSLFEKPVQLTLQKPSLKAFTNWLEFFKLGLPGCAMLCSEWWAFEILCIFASQLGSDAVSAQTIIGQLSALAFMIPLGISISVSSYVGHSLGAGDTSIALKYAHYSLLCVWLIELVICPIVYFFSPLFVSIFTSNQAVIDICVQISHLVTLFTFADGTQAICSGILRGTGNQLYGAIINAVSYYLIALPLAWRLTFHTSLGVAGLMTGISSAVVLQSVIILGMLFLQPNKIFVSILNHDNYDDNNNSKSSNISNSNNLKKEYRNNDENEYDESMDLSSHSMLHHHLEFDDLEDNIELETIHN